MGAIRWGPQPGPQRRDRQEMISNVSLEDVDLAQAAERWANEDINLTVDQRRRMCARAQHGIRYWQVAKVRANGAAARPLGAHGVRTRRVYSARRRAHREPHHRTCERAGHRVTCCC
jgi:hypothetical protein